MKCLMHYIVFFIKDYERTADKITWEMDVNILQNGMNYGQLPIRIGVNIVVGTPSKSSPYIIYRIHIRTIPPGHPPLVNYPLGQLPPWAATL